MKKMGFILALALLLCGCAAADTFETVGDEYIQSVMQQEKQVALTVEEGALILQGDTGTMYLCQGYEVTVEVLSAGNLNSTFQSLTGFGVDDLTVVETAAADAARYECVWTAAGEEGDVVGRAVILDDGCYHYCVTVTADADEAASLQETWKAIFDSIVITPTA